jgi:hypothetical protein
MQPSKTPLQRDSAWDREETIMLKSTATAVTGIVLGILATAEFAISPSWAQQLLPKSALCGPLVADWTQCRNGRFERCTRTGLRRRDVPEGCIWETRCKPTGRRCLVRPL